MYKIEEDSQGNKVVLVGEYVLMLHQDRIEVTAYGMPVDVHDYSENVRKLDALSNVIQYYHSCIGDHKLPF